MPCSASTSATAEMSASVFFDRSRPSTFSSVRSGITPEKRRVCFTCPAMIASETPAACRRLMHVPSWPSDTRCTSVPPSRAASASSSGDASSRTAMSVTSRPSARAASSTRPGKRPLPAIRPMRDMADILGPAGPRGPSYSSATTSSSRRVGRRKVTPRLVSRMKATRKRTSSQASDGSRSIRASACVVFSFDWRR